MYSPKTKSESYNYKNEDKLLRRQKARYCILGAIIGDALGASCEFLPSDKAKQIVEKSKFFANGPIGGGIFKLVPGQFTDDTEMALAIMCVIEANGYYDQAAVAQCYHSWYLSKPFDIGETTKRAVRHNDCNEMIRAAKELNNKSLSNGFLMRQFGLIGKYYNSNFSDLRLAIKSDIMLTHSHTEAFRIGEIYGIMLWLAIQGSNALEIYEWGKNNCADSKLVTSIYYSVEKNKSYFKYCDYKYKLSDIDTKNIGFVGFAFWLVLLSIKNKDSYYYAMLDIVSRGGDSDTNACIVGAIMAALYPDTVPAKWVLSVTSFKSDRFKQYTIANPEIWIKWLP